MADNNVFSDVEESLKLRRQTVLVVDDEADILESIKSLLLLDLKGVNVATAISGMEALKILKNEHVDLIMTDYKMPKMNGLQFLNEARKQAPTVPRVLITAFPDLDLAIKSINEAKIENFLTKPLDPRKVVEVVRDLLYERRAKQMRDASFARSLDTLRRRMTPPRKGPAP